MKKICINLLVLGFCFLVNACNSEDTTEQDFFNIKSNKNITIHSCESYSTLATPVGNLQNNVWNAHSVGDYKWEQCIGVRQTDGKKQYGWLWKWPSDGNTVYAQPQSTLGYSPWLNHDSITDSFPIAVDTLKQLTLDYDIEMSFSGELNLTSTLWLTTSSSINKEIDKSTIAVEMMIWTFSTNDFYTNPAGKKVAEVNINGVDWEVWLNRNWQDTSGINDNNWVYLAFRSKKNYANISFDAAKMLKFSLDNGYIGKDLYIADIQLGNEVMSGTGQTWIRKYNVSF